LEFLRGVLGIFDVELDSTQKKARFTSFNARGFDLSERSVVINNLAINYLV
jgi:hypothetical protein